MEVVGRNTTRGLTMVHVQNSMLFDKFCHGFVGFSNFLRIAASKPMFSMIDWDKGEGNALLFEFLRHQL